MREDFRRSSFKSEGVQGTGGGVGVGVASREDGSQHEAGYFVNFCNKQKCNGLKSLPGDDLRVDDMREHGDTEVLHRNDIGRCTRGAVASTQDDLGQCRVSGTAYNAHSQSSADEEEAESEVNHLESGLDVNAGANCFSGNNGDVLGTDDGKQSRRHGGQEALQPTEISSIDLLAECLAIRPISETVSVMCRVATNHGNKGEAEEGKDQDDFASGKPEFGFTVCFDRKDIDTATRSSSISSETLWLFSRQRYARPTHA